MRSDFYTLYWIKGEREGLGRNPYYSDDETSRIPETGNKATEGNIDPIVELLSDRRENIRVQCFEKKFFHTQWTIIILPVFSLSSFYLYIRVWKNNILGVGMRARSKVFVRA